MIAITPRSLVVLALVAWCVLGRPVGAQNRAAAGAGPGGPVTSPRLYVFDGGVLESDPGRYRLTKEDVGTTQLSIASFLVVHPRGVLLWDTNAVADDEWTPTGQPVVYRLTLDDGQSRQVTLQSTLRSQLAAAGYMPRDVTHLALSHYHWDHTANANAFASATWLVRPIEREAMFSGRSLGTVRTKLYAALKGSRTTLIEADEHDVFGDGTVVIKAAPGHSPGHQVLYVKLARTGGVVLSGDLYHYLQERTMNRLPTFEVSEEQTRESRSRLDAFLQRTGAQLWIQHNLTAHRQLRMAPAYYD
jgi:glyoxylase-like metal-dependent hydrolase (beta-lactamase superfamily II)